MELLFVDGTFCSTHTLKRLLLMGDHIAFMDRPSITFPDWGTVGVQSPVRRFDTSKSPVAISAFSPPGGPISDFYLTCLDKDFKNPIFIKTFFHGLKNDNFAWRFLQPDGDYVGNTGRQIRAALIADHALSDQIYDLPKGSDLKHKVSSSVERKSTFGVLAAEASFQVTNAIIMAGKSGFIPVTESLQFSKLLYTRQQSLQETSLFKIATPQLGLSILSSVIPDQLIQQLDIQEIFDYRSNSKSEHKHWLSEISSISAKLNSIDPDELNQEIPKILASDIQPKINEYYRELESIRDRQFGEALKAVTKWEFPTLSLAQLGGASWSQMATLFAGALLPAVSPLLIDYFLNSRDLKRKNSMTYLIEISERIKN